MAIGTVAVVAPGDMGHGVAEVLRRNGVRVVTTLQGRGPDSVARANRAGMVALVNLQAVVHEADVFLSILPPSRAIDLAGEVAVCIKTARKPLLYADCNAVAPETVKAIGTVITAAGGRFVDVGIIGLPPQPDGSAPWLYASGTDAARFQPLGDFGINVNVIEGPIGAASALKMSYAGITKGVTALGAMMMLAATRNGAAQGLRNEFDRSQKALLPWFQRSIPAMYSKAYRFVGEMDEIADFVGDDPAARKMYEAISEFYTRLAADFEGDKKEVNALSEILKKKD